MFADRLTIARPAEIAAKRLFADDMLAGLHGADDHLGMQGRWRADIDDVDGTIGEQLPIIAIGLRDAVLYGERRDVIAARDRRGDLGVDAVDALVGIHMQLGDEAAADEADP